MVVHLAAVTDIVTVVIDRSLYLPRDWAADEERREAAGGAEETMFTAKPQQATTWWLTPVVVGRRPQACGGDRGSGLQVASP